MSGQCRAWADDWAYQEKWEREDADARCLLELRSRVELLEATQHAHLDGSQLSEAEREVMTEPGKVEAWRHQHLIQAREVVTDQPEPSTVATDLLDAKAWAYIGKQAACGDSAAQSLVDLLNQPPTSQPAQPAPSPEKPSAPAPAGGLVERVASICASGSSLEPELWDQEARAAIREVWDQEARAAIREVAAWLRSEHPRREGYGTAWANLIEQEASQ